MKRSILILITSIISVIAVAQNMAKGIVFEDLNDNGKKERKEKGIAGVAVSNGKDVVLTDDKGAYQLSVSDDNIIFVIKPNNYKFPLKENGLPLFYYIHKPTGSPRDFKYGGHIPTGVLPKSVDFALLSSPESDNFTSLVFGDPQPNNINHIEYFKKRIVAELEGTKDAVFGISLGDIADNKLDLHQPYIEAMKPIGLPWHNVMGNHDMDYEATSDSLSTETFESSFGPATYSFNYGKAHFIIMDDVLYPDPRDNKSYWGGFRKDQFEFLVNDLKYVDKDKLIVFGMHIPIANVNFGEFRKDDLNKLFKLLEGYDNVLFLSAHTHVQKHNFFGKTDGWMQEKPLHEFNVGATCGDWYSGDFDERGTPTSMMHDGTPVGYAFLNIKGNQYSIDYKVSGKPKGYQMHIHHPKVVPHKKSVSSLITVNFFMGNKSDEVEYRIDKGEWKKMKRTEMADPVYIEMLSRWDNANTLTSSRWPSRASMCSHIWTTRIPTNLEPGQHKIEIRATDMFGNTFTQTSNYKIESPLEAHL